MTVKSIQAPVGGLNRRDSIDDMSETDALILDNWIPDSGRCRLRNGSLSIYDYGGPIETLMDYGSQFILAVDGDLVESGLTTPTSVGTPVVLGTGYTSNKWDWEVFGNNLLMVNGADTPQQYDGVTVTDINFTSGLTNPEELIGCDSFKGRMFYWKAEAGFYYANAGSYQGEMFFFDLSPFVSKLSTLKLFFQWSVDAGDGTDDFAIFVMDTGEILMYQGTDPGSIDFWSLSGKYKTGEPLSLRASTSIGGDEILLTRDGWQNFHTIWTTGDFRNDGIGAKIVGLATDAAERFGTTQGWEVQFFAEERLVLVNVPQGSGVYIQHVLNTNTMSWSTFSGWNSVSYGEFGGAIYFGDEMGNLHIAMYRHDDSGMPITTDGLPAFSYLSGRANNKQLTAIRPITTIDRPDTIGINAAADYKIPPPPVADYVPTPDTASPWGSPWGSPWARSNSEAEGEWQSANEFGYTASYRMQTVTTGQSMDWYSSAMMFKNAGVI